MANFTKVRGLCRLYNKNSRIFNSINRNTLSKNGVRHLSTTNKLNDLMEFFDDQKNWNESEVRSGRSWNQDELRLKSNSDLHKLWYVLLKEKNMLLTMEEECKREVRLFPSPERIDKIEDSMENLETVIRERNRAYHELETGKTGEQEVKTITGPFGLPVEYKLTEHSIPKEINKKWQEEQSIKCHPDDVKQFVLKYKEKEYLTNKRKKRRDFNHVIGLLNRFPNMDLEAVKEQYPDVDIEKAKASRKYKPPPVFD